LPRKLRVWNSHGDKLTRLPPGFEATGTTENSPYAVIEDRRRRFHGIQFHPEVFHTERGVDVIRNFLLGVCGVKADWTTRDFISHAIEGIRAQVGKGRVLLGLSGGVDSSVAAALLHRAIGSQLTCVFVDNGPSAKVSARRLRSFTATTSASICASSTPPAPSCGACGGSRIPSRSARSSGAPSSRSSRSRCAPSAAPSSSGRVRCTPT